MDVVKDRTYSQATKSKIKNKAAWPYYRKARETKNFFLILTCADCTTVLLKVDMNSLIQSGEQGYYKEDPTCTTNKHTVNVHVPH